MTLKLFMVSKNLRGKWKGNAINTKEIHPRKRKATISKLPLTGAFVSFHFVNLDIDLILEFVTI